MMFLIWKVTRAVEYIKKQQQRSRKEQVEEVQEISNVRGLTVADVGGSTAVSIVTDVREGEFTENTAARLRRERLVRAQVKAYPAVSANQEKTSHGLIEDNVHPYPKRCGWCAVLVKRKGHTGL